VRALNELLLLVGAAARWDRLQVEAMTDHETPGEPSERLDRFVQRLIDAQSRLRAFIAAALGNRADAADVLQKTNMVLWKKAEDYRHEAEFLPWALAIARFEVLAFLRDYRRDRHVFSDDVAPLILDAAAAEVASPSDRQAALQECLEKLPSHSRTLLWQRYRDDMTIKQICIHTGRSEDSIKSRILRIRKKLETCVETMLRTGSA
jgi:RNA polymerase sigma-70 factor (ECF subfamily)